MYFDTAMVLAGGLGTALAFGLFRLFVMWRRWSNASKENDEIDWDRKIADAIKQGDVELIAQLRKYFLNYKRSDDKKRSRDGSQSTYMPNTLYLCKEGKFWFVFDEKGEIQVLKALKWTFGDGDKESVLKVCVVTEDGKLKQRRIKKFKNFEALSSWLREAYNVDPEMFRKSGH